MQVKSGTSFCSNPASALLCPNNYLLSEARTDEVLKRWRKAMEQIKNAMKATSIEMKYIGVRDGDEAAYRDLCFEIVKERSSKCDFAATGVVLSVSSYREGQAPRELIFWVDMGVEIVVDDRKSQKYEMHGTRTGCVRVAVLLCLTTEQAETVFDVNNARSCTHEAERQKKGVLTEDIGPADVVGYFSHFSPPSGHGATTSTPPPPHPPPPSPPPPSAPRGQRRCAVQQSAVQVLENKDYISLMSDQV